MLVSIKHSMPAKFPQCHFHPNLDFQSAQDARDIFPVLFHRNLVTIQHRMPAKLCQYHFHFNSSLPLMTLLRLPLLCYVFVCWFPSAIFHFNSSFPLMTLLRHPFLCHVFVCWFPSAIFHSNCPVPLMTLLRHPFLCHLCVCCFPSAVVHSVSLFSPNDITAPPLFMSCICV